MDLNRTEGGTWDTDTITGFWVLGVTNSINSTLLNHPDGSLSNPIPIDNGSRLYLFGADLSLPPYFQFGTYTVKISFEDGGIAAATYTIVQAASPTVTP
jgi:hypothetical protein